MYISGDFCVSRGETFVDARQSIILFIGVILLKRAHTHRRERRRVENITLDPNLVMRNFVIYRAAPISSLRHVA